MSAVWAREAGWRRMTSVTPMPSRMSRVAAAAAATTGTGSNQMWGLGWVAACGTRSGVQIDSGNQCSRWSAHQMASNPCCSRRWAAASTASAGGRTAPIADSSRPGCAMARNLLRGCGASNARGWRAGVLMVAAPELRARVDGDLGDDRPAVAGPSRRAR